MKRPANALVLMMAMSITAWAQTTITIEKVARSVGNGTLNRDLALTDPVPGRGSGFVFWSSAAEPPAPVINAGGEVVFKGFSAATNNINSGGEFGIYVKRPGFPLAVVMDTTVDGTGAGSYAVPGHPGSRFFAIDGAPLVNNAGDIVFQARFLDTTTFASGTGLYSTTTSGGPFVKIVDQFDPVAGQTASTNFETFTFSANNPSTFGASLNDSGQVAYWARFCDGPCTSTSRQTGVFGTSVSGTTHTLLVDSTRKICPTGIPFGLSCDPSLDEGFWDVRPEFALNNAGIVAFHGGIRRSTGSNIQGAYAVSVSGGVAPVTVALQFQTAPPATPSAPVSTYAARFDDNEINDAGDYLFQPLLTAPCCVQQFGLFSSDVLGGPQGHVVDTLAGNGLVVPNEIAGAEFATLAMASINEAGQMGFYSAIRNSGTSNNNGIYAADIFGSPISLVMDANSTPPGLAAGAAITNFGGQSAIINDDGHMVFAGTGLVPVESGFESLYGLYFYDACTNQVLRISDSTTSLSELGVAFGGITSGGTIGYQVYRSGAARAGKYTSMNNSGDVAFLAKFSNFGMGIYVAHVSVGSGGAVAITCPPDLSLACGDSTDVGATGTATSSGCATGTISFSDTTTSNCGGTETISRTWTADDGAGGSATCVQTIILTDTDAPTLSGVPEDLTVECDAVPAIAEVIADDACDANPTVTATEQVISGSCPNNKTLIRTWTGEDGCGNSVTADQIIGVADTTPPIITCPPDALGLECPSDTSIAARGSATAVDACGGALITSSDSSVPGFGSSETITRTWTATDDCGQSSSCTQTIEVIDTTAPTVSCSVLTDVLWSPDHNLVTVGLEVAVTDECDEGSALAAVTVQIWSDETEIPDTGDGTGRFAPDAKDLDAGLRLRNERRGSEDGRIYLIVARSEDGSGNVGFGTCTVVAPNNQSQAGLDEVASSAAAAELTVASTPGTTIADRVAPLVGQGWTQHGISGELGPKQ